MSGTGQWTNAQIRAVEDYFARVKSLRDANLIDEQTAYQAQANAFVEMQRRIQEAHVQAAQVRLEYGSTEWVDVAISSLGRLAIGFTNLNAGATEAMGNFFQSFTDGFANSVGRAIVYSENLGQALVEVARQGVAALISALVKLGVQWLVNAALGRSIAAASMTAAVATAAAAGTATAAAWAPAAAMTSLASFGANAIPASAAIVQTTALAEGLALSGLAGFQKGGYTGDAPVDQIVGPVHGKEFVFDATSVRRIGVNNLEAIRSGTKTVRERVSRNGSSDAPAVTTAQLNARIVNVMDPRIVADFLATAEGEQTVLNVMRRNSDAVRTITAEG
jgi:hypothetical protein